MNVRRSARRNASNFDSNHASRSALKPSLRRSSRYSTRSFDSGFMTQLPAKPEPVSAVHVGRPSRKSPLWPRSYDEAPVRSLRVMRRGQAFAWLLCSEVDVARQARSRRVGKHRTRACQSLAEADTEHEHGGR